jgi:hypothetical protein
LNRICLLLFLAWVQPGFAQSLSTQPNFASTLKNPIDLRVQFEGVAADYDWQQIQVRLDGADFSDLARTILAGPLAVGYGDQFLLTEQTSIGNQLTIRLWGFRAPVGPHQVQVILPGKTAQVKPLTLEGLFAVR